jgi:hypothetical protein
MVIDTEWHYFNDEDIQKATTSIGLYALYKGSETIYLGKAEGVEGIRGRLKSHKAGNEGACTQFADYFNYMVCFDPRIHEIKLLDKYKKLYKKLPRCSDYIPIS